MPRLPRAAGGAREEDHAIGGPRDLLEGADHLGLAAAGLGVDRDRGPHALRRAGGGTPRSGLLLLRDLDVALGDQLLAVTRAHPQELHRGRLCHEALAVGPRGASGGRASAPGRRRDRPPRRSRAGRRAPPRAAIARARAAASSGVWPSARWAASADVCVQPDPCAAPSGWRSPAIRWMASPSNSTSVACSRWPPVTTTTLGAERVQRAGERLGRSAAAPAGAGEHARLGQVRRDHGRARQQQLDERRARRVVEQHRAGLGHHHGVDHDRRARRRAGRAPRRPRRRSPRCRASRSSPRRRRCRPRRRGPARR